MRIEEYALIGDCHTAALVGKNGSIDWLCLPRFDSPACFAALLGTPNHGHWRIAPTGEVTSVRRRYRDATLILETEIETEQGRVLLIDCMPPRSQSIHVVRRVECLEGQVPMQMDLVIRFDYGSIVPWVRRVEHGICATAGPDTLYCIGDVEMQGQDMRTVAKFTLTAGELKHFLLTWSPTYGPQPQPANVDQLIHETEQWWTEWSGRCTYQGEWRDAVLRSLITLKALTYLPTGGLVAAPTTSLPEYPGGVRNWDYRYCWLRDATFTLYALITGGYTAEAQAWRDWLVNAVAGTPDDMQIMYGLAGERRLTEMELPWLPGYENSHPVRIGNAAAEQHQLDVYGEVMDTLLLAGRAGLKPTENAWRVLQELLTFVEHDWREPDDGIWEVRGPRRHFVHSKVMAWVAMDRGVKAAKHFHLPGDVDVWRRVRGEIHQQVCREGFDSDLNSFVQFYGSKNVDASLLMLPIVGFLPPQDPRMAGTVDAIQRHLTRNGFVDRYPTVPDVDGLPPKEGSFLLCNFWLADNLALLGRREEARALFEKLLALRNDVGLLAEEYDPETGRLLGNFPQALSHVGLINTARHLTRSGGPAEDRPAANSHQTTVSS